MFPELLIPEEPFPLPPFDELPPDFEPLLPDEAAFVELPEADLLLPALEFPLLLPELFEAAPEDFVEADFVDEPDLELPFDPELLLADFADEPDCDPPVDPELLVADFLDAVFVDDAEFDPLFDPALLPADLEAGFLDSVFPAIGFFAPALGLAGVGLPPPGLLFDLSEAGLFVAAFEAFAM